MKHGTFTSSDGIYRTPAQATKTLMVLGLLLERPRHGYELHQIVEAHGTVYAELKKPTLYHLLGRLAVHGLLTVKTETGARGRRGERLIYAMTRRGRGVFDHLLRQTLRTYDPAHSSLEVATVYLHWLPATEVKTLLEERRASVLARRDAIVGRLKTLTETSPQIVLAARHLAADHAIGHMDAELTWIECAISILRRQDLTQSCTGKSKKAREKLQDKRGRTLQ